MRSIKKIFFAILFTGILSQCVYLLFLNGIKKYDAHKSERLNEILLQNTNYDMVFLGSSRIHVDIYPRIIDSITQLNTYNLGVEGGNIFESKLTLDAYLVNHPSPKYLILSVDYRGFDLTRKLFNYTQYFPFVKNPVIKKMLIEQGHYNNIFDFIKFLELTETDDYTKINSMKGIRGISEIPDGDFQYKGYMSNSTNTILSDNVVYDTSKNRIFPEGLILLQGIVDTCKQRGIQLIFVSLPNYKQLFTTTAYNFEATITIVDSFARKTNSPFWRHDKYPICDSPSLFSNMGHLNKPGSFVYSTILGNELLSYIKERSKQ